MTTEQQRVVAAAARKVLAQQLERQPYVPNFVRVVIESFMRSYDADTAAGFHLLERMLDRERLVEYGRYELQPIAYEIDHVHDADALSHIYRVTFSDINLGTGSMLLGTPSVGINLTQDAADSLTGARYALARHFEAFLDEHPAAALAALASALTYSLHSTNNESDDVFEVNVNGQVVAIARDGSQWDDQPYNHHDDWWTMVSTFEDRLRTTLAAGDVTLFNIALLTVPRETTGSFLWRVMLRASGTNATAAASMLSFVATRSVLDSSEFGSPLRDYLAAAFPLLSDHDKQVVVAALLEYVSYNGGELEQHARRKRAAEFIDALPAGSLEIGHPLLGALDVGTENPEPLDDDDDVATSLALNGFHMSSGTISAVRFSDVVRRAGASPEVIAEVDTLEAYFSEHPRKAASLPKPAVDVIESLNRISQTASAAARRAILGIMAMIMRDALGADILLSPTAFDAWETIAREMIAEPPPPWNDAERVEQERQFAERSYGTTGARNMGVEILYILYSRQPSPSILEAIRQLERDVDPAIRADVAEGARFALAASPEEAWTIIENGFADTNVGVWRSALSATQYAPSGRRQRVFEMYVEAFTRVEQFEKLQDFRLFLVRSVIDLAVQFENSDARARLSAVIDNPWDFQRTSSSLVFELGNTVASPNAAWERREWAAVQLLRMITALVQESERLRQLHGSNLDEYPAPDRERIQIILKLLADAAQRLFYASGILQQATANSAFASTGRVDARSYALLRPLIVVLGRVPFAPVSYHLIKLLFGAVEVAPRDVLLLGYQAVNNGAQVSLAGDPQAEDDIRDFVTRYVRHHRGLLEGDRECLAAVMDVVDIFVHAGWPRWIGVVAELDGIYRSS